MARFSFLVMAIINLVGRYNQHLWHASLFWWQWSWTWMAGWQMGMARLRILVALMMNFDGKLTNGYGTVHYFGGRYQQRLWAAAWLVVVGNNNYYKRDWVLGLVVSVTPTSLNGCWDGWYNGCKRSWGWLLKRLIYIIKGIKKKGVDSIKNQPLTIPLSLFFTLVF